MEEPGRETGGVGRRERTPTDGAGQTLLAQERAICRIFDGFIFEATRRSGLVCRDVCLWHLRDVDVDAQYVRFQR